MAIRFTPLDLDEPGLFGIGLSGTVSRTDKQNLLALAEKCLARGKLHLVLDMTGLSAIGGGGARVLADFQLSLSSRNGEAVFVGAGEVVRRFLRQKFDDLPLRFFPSVEVARTRFCDPQYSWDPDAGDAAGAGMLDEDTDDIWSRNDVGASECGAIAACPDEGREAMQDVLEEFNGGDEDVEPALSGRRRDHRYTSLAEAAMELGHWQPGQRDAEFADALRNLLFSHGLASDALLLTCHEDLYADHSEQWVLPANGSLVVQLMEAEGPLTMLDIADNDLLPPETALLEHLTPDLMLPIRQGGQMVAALLLVRGEHEQEYTVAEHFALELLMRLLASDAPAESGSGNVEPVQASQPEAAPPDCLPSGQAWAAVDRPDEVISDVLMQMALDLPDAHDGPHFWRLLARHVWPVLPLRSLGFLAPGMHRAQVVAGNPDNWQGLEFGDEKLRHFLRSMERPVRVANLPAFFQRIRESLQEAGVDWIVGLNWKEQFLGTVLIGLDDAFVCDDTPELLSEIFAEAARLLGRIGTDEPAADMNLEIIRLLVEQHEKRSCGDRGLTQAIAGHLTRFSRALGFTPEQERDLIYGGLLRDIGLIAKEDALMGPRTAMDPTQWPKFRQHPTEGAAMLRNLHAPQMVLDVVQAHHERFNGKGFPMGLKGRQIPLAARIVKVVECWVSLAAGDAAKAPVDPQEAMEFLRVDQGERFDPEIVGVFLKALQPDLQGAKRA